MVKMLNTTYYDGTKYLQGESYSVDSTIENRWIKNKIAESEGNKFQSMTDEQLADYAFDNEIDISKAKSRTAVIKLLK